MKPLFNFIENINLQFNHQKSAEQNNNDNKKVNMIKRQTGYDFKRKRLPCASTGKEELPLPSNGSCHTEFELYWFSHKL